MNDIEILEHKNSLLEKCILLRRRFRIERTDEALQELRDAENERHRFYYKHNKQTEKERMARWQKEQNKIILTCEACNIQFRKLYLTQHTKTKKHIGNLSNLNDKNPSV